MIQNSSTEIRSSTKYLPGGCCLLACDLYRIDVKTMNTSSDMVCDVMFTGFPPREMSMILLWSTNIAITIHHFSAGNSYKLLQMLVPKGQYLPIHPRGCLLYCWALRALVQECTYHLLLGHVCSFDRKSKPPNSTSL